MPRSIDYSGLIYPVNAHDVAEFKASRRDHFGYSQFGSTAKIALVIAVVGFFVVIAGGQILGAITLLISTASLEGALAAALPVLLMMVFVLLIAGGAIVAAVRGWRRSGGPWQRFYRMNKFADDNDLTFAPLDRAISYPGLIFNKGNGRSMHNRFRSASGRRLDYGNFRYTTGSGKNRRTHNWGFMALQLDRALPHMVLDARSNNQLFGVSNLPQVFARNQVLKLEGDFNSHFTLYCPQQYERDALYIFTPDLMGLLIDNAAPYDVEVVDTWLLVYSPKPFDLIDPAQHRRLLGIADTVGTKTLRQSRNYADERIGDSRVNLIAPQGQRLKGGISIAAFVTVGAFFAVWVGSLLLGF